MSRSRSTTLPRIPRDAAGYRMTRYDRTGAPETTEAPPVLELPADLSALTDQELADLESAAVTAFDAIAALEQPSDTDADEAERIAGIVTAVREKY